MIFLNGKEITVKHFTDGALDMKIEADMIVPDVNTIEWRFDNNEELVVLCFLAKHLKSKGIRDIDLNMPYIPNARKDRAHRYEDVFTMKYFAEMLNGLGFRRVVCLDPHSTVSEALIDRIDSVGPEANVNRILDILGRNTILFYPDEGACKRYAGMFDRDYVYGLKSRNKETRTIETFQICGDTSLIRGKNVLMIDDICASGKTLEIAAKKLKALGANFIYAYVSHCEDTVLTGELLKNITTLYTTNSILRKSHPKIRLLDDGKVQDRFVPKHTTGFFGEIDNNETVDTDALDEELRIAFSNVDNSRL